MPVSQMSERLFVLPADARNDPMSGLTSERMRRLIAQASSAFDWVIIDTPPVGLLPDASLLSALVDGVLLVIRSGKAPFPLVKAHGRSPHARTHSRRRDERDRFRATDRNAGAITSTTATATTELLQRVRTRGERADSNRESAVDDTDRLGDGAHA